MPALADPLDLAAKAFWARHQDVRDAAFTRMRAERPVFWSGPAESDLLPPEENVRGFCSSPGTCASSRPGCAATPAT